MKAQILIQKIMLAVAILMSLSTPYAFADSGRTDDFNRNIYDQSPQQLQLNNSPTINGELSSSIKIQNEEEVLEIIDSLSEKEEKTLRKNLRTQLLNIKKNWRNDEYCVPAGSLVLAVAIGLAASVVLIPLSVALLVLSIPVSVVDAATGCQHITLIDGF